MYPAINDMDGCHHQVICFSDLTTEERRLVTNDDDYDAMLRLAGNLADRLHRLAHRLHRAGTTINKFGEKILHFVDEEADPE